MWVRARFSSEKSAPTGVGDCAALKTPWTAANRSKDHSPPGWKIAHGCWKPAADSWKDAAYCWTITAEGWKTKYKPWKACNPSWTNAEGGWTMPHEGWTNAATGWKPNYMNWKADNSGWTIPEARWTNKYRNGKASISSWTIPHQGWKATEKGWKLKAPRWRRENLGKTPLLRAGVRRGPGWLREDLQGRDGGATDTSPFAALARTSPNGVLKALRVLGLSASGARSDRLVFSWRDRSVSQHQDKSS